MILELFAFCIGAVCGVFGIIIMEETTRKKLIDLEKEDKKDDP